MKRPSMAGQNKVMSGVVFRYGALQTALTKSLLTIAILNACTSAYGFTNEEWAAIPSNWDGYQSWVNGVATTGSQTIEIRDDVIRSSSSYDDLRNAAIGLVNYGLKTGDYTSELSIQIDNPSKTLSIDMSGNPHAGILVARTVQDRVATWSGHPSLSIKGGGLDIYGDLKGATASDTGDFTAGIAIGVGEFSVEGDTKIELTGMNSQSQAERKPVPEMTYKWAQYFGWTNLDGRRGSGHESDLIETNRSYLLQGGLVTGLANLHFDGDVDIHVSGKNGILGGWIQAPNTENWHVVPEAFAEMTSFVKGNTIIHAELEEGANAYGLFGMAVQRGQMGSSNLPEIAMTFDGDIDITLDGNGGTLSSVYEDDDPLRESSYRLETANAIGLYTYGAGIHKTGDIGIRVTGVEEASSVGGFELAEYSSIQAAHATIDIDVSNNGSAIGRLFGFSARNNPDRFDTETIDWNTVGNLKVNVEGSADEILGLIVDGTYLSINSAEIVVTRQNGGDSRNDYAVKLESSIFDSEVRINEGGQGVARITGNLFVEANNTRLKVNFGKGDYLVGNSWVDLYEEYSNTELDDYFGQFGPGLWYEDINLAFSEGASWQVTGDSNVTNLSLETGGMIDLSRTESESTARQSNRFSRILDIRNFKGVSVEDKASAGIFQIDADLSQPPATQTGSLIAVLGSVDAQKNYAQLQIRSSGIATAEYSRPLVLDSSDGRNLELELVENATTGRNVELGAWLYELRSVVDEDGTIAEAFDSYFENDETLVDEYGSEYFAEKGDRYWYLARTGKTNPTTDDVVSASSFGLQIAQYLGHLSTLRDRLGDVRYGAEEGAWVRAVGARDRIRGLGGSSHQVDSYTVYAGLDSRLKDSDWTVGGYLRAGKTDGEGRGLSSLQSDGESYGGSLYAAWNGRENEHCTPYADIVFSADRFSEDLSGFMADGLTAYEGGYDTWGWGASVEVGSRFNFIDYPGWFAEPSLQLSYYRINGRNFNLSNGLSLSQSDVDSLTGRIGLTGGRFWIENGRKTFELYGEIGLNHEFLGKQTISANDASYSDEVIGTRIYYGLGITKTLNDDGASFWLQLSREEGRDYTRQFEANAGIRWLF